MTFVRGLLFEFGLFLVWLRLMVWLLQAAQRLPLGLRVMRQATVDHGVLPPPGPQHDAAAHRHLVGCQNWPSTQLYPYTLCFFFFSGFSGLLGDLVANFEPMVQ